MTPLEIIEQGIKSADIGMIAEGYRLMTGKDIVSDTQIAKDESEKPVKKTNKAKSSKKSKQDVTKNDFRKEVEDFHMQIRDPQKSREREGGGTFTRSEPINIEKLSVIGNMYEDTKTDAVEDLGVTSKLQVRPLTPRSREASNTQFVEKSCDVCGKSQLVNRAYITTRYVCDKCVRNKMGR